MTNKLTTSQMMTLIKDLKYRLLEIMNQKLIKSQEHWYLLGEEVASTRAKLFNNMKTKN